MMVTHSQKQEEQKHGEVDMSYSAQAAITKYCRLGGLNGNVFSPSFRSLKVLDQGCG